MEWGAGHSNNSDFRKQNGMFGTLVSEQVAPLISYNEFL